MRITQSLDPTGARFDKSLAHGQAHMGQMDKSPWRCLTSGLDNSTELEWIKSATGMRDVCSTQPGGLRGKKKHSYFDALVHSLYQQNVTKNLQDDNTGTDMENQ